MSNVIDLPTQLPKRPDGSLNIEQIVREFRNDGSLYLWSGGSTGYAKLPDANVTEYVAAIVDEAHLLRHYGP